MCGIATDSVVLNLYRAQPNVVRLCHRDVADHKHDISGCDKDTHTTHTQLAAHVQIPLVPASWLQSPDSPPPPNGAVAAELISTPG